MQHSLLTPLTGATMLAFCKVKKANEERLRVDAQSVIVKRFLWLAEINQDCNLT